MFIFTQILHVLITNPQPQNPSKLCTNYNSNTVTSLVIISVILLLFTTTQSDSRILYCPICLQHPLQTHPVSIQRT